MKLSIKIFITFILCSIFSYGCQKMDSGTDKETGNYEVLGTYRFNQTDYDILSVKYVNDGDYLMFSFSPLPKGEKMTTYAVFGIRTYWLDKEMDIKDVDHNDDYIFTYEDPEVYYSQYRAPIEGSFLVKNNDSKNNNYTIKIDLILPDGTPFQIDYTGDFVPEETDME